MNVPKQEVSCTDADTLLTVSEGRHSRWPLLGLVTTVVAAATLALTGAAKQVPGLEFIPSGHWVASPALGLVVRINGAIGKADAQVSVPGLRTGTRVLQDEAHGYVVGSRDVTIFGKSTLSVEKTVPPPVSGERPVPVETAGGAYSVYRESGQIVRFNTDLGIIPAGGPLGPPVTTSDGTLWVHRTDSGAICSLARGATALSCPAVAPAGHGGALSVSGDRVVFVDTTDDTMSVVRDKGFGPAVKVGFDVPPDARLSPADAAGRIAVLDPTGHRLHLLEARADESGEFAGQRPPAQTVQLEAGEYDGPSVSGDSFVLLDHRNKSVRTYDNQGRQRNSAPLPQENGRPEIVRGEDGRVYVDGGEGKHVVVVERDGSVRAVPVVGAQPEEKRQPAPPPPEPTTENPTTQPPPETGRPVPPPTRTQPPTIQPPTNQAQPPPVQTPPPIPVTPPGMPQNLAVAITPQQNDATVTWGAAAANGGPVTAYHVSWQSEGGRAGNATVTTLSHVIRGIWEGTDYPFTVTVVAENSAGPGTPATVRQVPPRPVPRIVLTKGDHADECDRPDCYWMHIVMTGFEPNTDYDIEPHSTGNYHNSGHRSRTDSQGNKVLDAFYYHVAGDTVWVTVGDIESNRLEWTE